MLQIIDARLQIPAGTTRLPVAHLRTRYSRELSNFGSLKSLHAVKVRLTTTYRLSARNKKEKKQRNL